MNKDHLFNKDYSFLKKCKGWNRKQGGRVCGRGVGGSTKRLNDTAENWKIGDWKIDIILVEDRCFQPHN